METKNISAVGTVAADAPLKKMNIQRRSVTPHDVQIEILYCGICHSDLHTARNEWHDTIYPIVPGHEIVGRVTGAGKLVSRFKVGDVVAVGCMVDSCRECEYCKEGLEQYCEPGKNSPRPQHGSPQTSTHRRESQLLLSKRLERNPRSIAGA